MDAYHETSLTNKNGAHHHRDLDPRSQELKPDQPGHPEPEVFSDPASCPRYNKPFSFAISSSIMIVAPFVTVLQKYNLHLKPISSPLFSLLAVMVVIWQILSRYWCWPLLQTQRGRGAGGPGGWDLAVPSHARPRHPGDLAGGAGGSRGSHPGPHHPAPPPQQGQDHEGQQGDHEEAAGASHLHREYLLWHSSTLMLHADLKGRVLCSLYWFRMF